MVAVGLDVPEALLTDLGLAADMEEAASREIGGTWLRGKGSLGLIVPSRVIPLERNVVLNPAHSDMALVSIVLTERFRFDPRLTPPQ